MENIFNILKLIWEFVINSQWIASIFGGFVAFLLTYFFYPYIKKRAETLAEQRAAKKTAYNEEKGKNAATKEDIEEITRKIEEVKTEISFANQRKHERIVEQEKCLVDISYYANLIGNMGLRLNYYLTYQSDRTKIDKYLEDLENYSTNLIYNRNKAKISIDDAELIKVIDDLVVSMTDYTSELSARAANAGQIIDACNEIEKAKDYLADITDEDKMKATEFILEQKDELQRLMNVPVIHRNEFKNACEAYLRALKKHFCFELQ